jgi:phosphopantothenoylcysteine decarboxylase/phosphopantothenate--cysteine ligase
LQSKTGNRESEIMKVLITAGPTREPIDPVRFISNRSSGRMGLSLIHAALAARHEVTAILGPVCFDPPAAVQSIAVETTHQMHQALLAQFPQHDLLIMAAAPADFRPRHVAPTKLTRAGLLTLDLEATEDIVASAARVRTPAQRIVGFALEAEGNLFRAREKLQRKHLDMIVFNPLSTMNSPTIQATLLYPDDRNEALPPVPKEAFAAILLERAAQLFPAP